MIPFQWAVLIVPQVILVTILHLAVALGPTSLSPYRYVNTLIHGIVTFNEAG